MRGGYRYRIITISPHTPHVHLHGAAWSATGLPGRLLVIYATTLQPLCRNWLKLYGYLIDCISFADGMTVKGRAGQKADLRPLPIVAQVSKFFTCVYFFDSINILAKKHQLGNTMKLLILTLVSVSLLSACANMPTPTSQITPAYTSDLAYEQYKCDRLAIEQNALARRENQLVIAQEQRVKSSKVQAFWLGYGQGDGVEASELAKVRGESEAVRKAMEVKKCATE